jgi:hypothetical protein
MARRRFELGRIIAILVGLPLLYIVAILAASELGGEVVKLETADSKGHTFVTSLWIVDFDRAAWLRAGNPDSDWLAHLRADPLVFVTRDGERRSYRAEVFKKLSAQVNAAMREKYGRADQLVSTIHDPEEVVAIRLVEP